MKSLKWQINLESAFNRLYVLGPWAFFAGMIHFNFQKFCLLRSLYHGKEFLDFFTVADVYVVLLFVVCILAVALKKIRRQKRGFPLGLKICIFLLLLAGVLQIFFQVVYEPVLSTPIEYFRSLFLFPLLYLAMGYLFLTNHVISRLMKSYLLMGVFFCLLALIQFYTGIFPGEQFGFMHRLVWPFVDFLTLKSTSSNWVAFFITPVFLFSFFHISIPFKELGLQLFFVRKARSLKKFATVMKKISFYLPVFVFSGWTLLLTQSYGAFVAVFVAVAFYLFRFLSLKQFAMGIAVLAVLGFGVAAMQLHTEKFQIMTGQEDYKYADSVSSRADIYTMNIYILKTYPLLGVGLNQYQSYFKQNQLKVLGRKINESQIPPHAHNFFTGFFTNLGMAGLLAMVILAISVFWVNRLRPEHPGVFVFLAIMVHGIIDSYYWKQEIAYTFWLVVLFAYLYRISSSKEI